MNFQKIASELLIALGGKENIIKAAHCATRLRLVLKNEKNIDKKVIENIDGVKGLFSAAGQFQIIFGTGTVNKVYDEFIKVADIKESSKEELKEQSKEKLNPFQRLIRVLGDVFVPIIPAIVASGLMMGLTESLNYAANNGFININTSSSFFVFLGLFSNIAYIFLPVLIGFSAAGVFGANKYLGAVIAMIMIHPNLQNAWTVSGEGIKNVQSVWFGLYEIPMVGYQGHVLPIIIAVFIMSIIEKKLHKIVPEILDLFATPLITVFITGYITLTTVGPLFVALENGIIVGVQQLIQMPFGIGGFIMGGLYSATVVTGVHHMYTIIDLGQISQFGYTYFMPIASSANIAQGGASLAVGLKTKNKKLKALAFPAALSAFLGITEPAIFGVNLRFVKPFIAAAIGAACA
uniref:PTS transporter subunit EIIC n=1 Tax=Clostridium sp. TaxID=1506 RepID=UPI0026269AC8